VSKYHKGQLHPELEVKHVLAGIEPGPLTWEVCKPSRKEPSRQIVDGYSEHLHMSLRQVK
jgi:hypothetical protein